eukprot:7366541-Prymnesium_polylepis.1
MYDALQTSIQRCASEPLYALVESSAAPSGSTASGLSSKNSVISVAAFRAALRAIVTAEVAAAEAVVAAELAAEDAVVAAAAASFG